MPPAEDIASLHEVLCIDRLIALEWQCYGRRPPTPEPGQIVQQEAKTKLVFFISYLIYKTFFCNAV